MSRYASNKPAAAPRKGGNPLWAGILIGMIAGVGLAAGLAWYMMKSPGPFTQKSPDAGNGAMNKANPLPAAEPAPPQTSQVPATSGEESGKPRFEFYNVLTDKSETKAIAPAKQADKPGTREKAKTAEKSASVSKPAAPYEPQILQVGSFSSAEDAEKTKAKLAFIGAEAHIQAASIPDKGMRYRVRLGPYNSEAELDRARTFLKQNDMDGTPMRAQ